MNIKVIFLSLFAEKKNDQTNFCFVYNINETTSNHSKKILYNSNT